jgi:hypothetical protein
MSKNPWKAENRRIRRSRKTAKYGIFKLRGKVKGSFGSKKGG